MALRLLAPHSSLSIGQTSAGEGLAGHTALPFDFTGGAGDDHCIDATPGSNLDGGGGTDTLTMTRGGTTPFTLTFTPGGTFNASDATHIVSFEYIELTTGKGNDNVTFNNPLTAANPLGFL